MTTVTDNTALKVQPVPDWNITVSPTGALTGPGVGDPAAPKGPFWLTTPSVP